MIVHKGNIWLVISVEDGVDNGKILAKFETENQAKNWLYDTGSFQD